MGQAFLNIDLFHLHYPVASVHYLIPGLSIQNVRRDFCEFAIELEGIIKKLLVIVRDLILNFRL